MAANLATMPTEVTDILLAAVRQLANRPEDAFYTEDVCDLRYEPGYAHSSLGGSTSRRRGRKSF
jgi:hypothetical protein